MKKALALIVVLCIALTLAACGASEPQKPAEKQQTNIIAVCLPTLDNPLMVGIGEAVTKAFPGKDVKVTSADGDPANQISQVQNYITMNADMIVIMPADAASMTSVLADARKAGIKVLVCGTELGDAEAYDCMATCNQYLVGSYSAYLTKKWVDSRYPNASAGSIECAALVSSLNEDSKNKSNGMLQIFEQYLKDQDGNFVDGEGKVVSEANKLENPAYCPALKLVQKTDAEMADAAQTAFQNILLTNPAVKVVMCCTGDGAGAVSQVFMDLKLSAAEYEKIGVFGCGFIGAEKGFIEDAAKGLGVFRATVAFGGGDLPGEMAKLAAALLDGSAQKDIWDPIALVYVDNTGALQMTDVKNIGSIQAAEVNW